MEISSLIVCHDNYKNLLSPYQRQNDNRRYLKNPERHFFHLSLPTNYLRL